MKKHIRGYGGFYNGHFIRSTLEYTYIYLLNLDGQPYEYEPETFTLSTGQTYKPDLRINGQFVEIKGAYTYEKDMPKIRQFEAEFNLTVTVLTESDIKAMYKARNLSYYKVVNHWKAKATHTSGFQEGIYNPRYGTVVSLTTRNLISQKAAARMRDPEYKKRWLQGIRRISRKGRGAGERVPRSQRLCPVCGKVMRLTAAQLKRKTCSRQCAYKNRDVPFTGTQQAVQNRVNQREKAGAIIKSFVQAHPDRALECKYNGLTALNDLWNQVTEQTGIRDFRTISQAVLGRSGGRKEMLAEMQSWVENIVRTNENEIVRSRG